MAAPGGRRSGAPFDWLTSWSWDPLVSVSLAISAGLYARGLVRLWRTPAGRRAVRPWQAAAFAVGWLSLVIALLSPLDVLERHPLLGPHDAARAADGDCRAADGARAAADRDALGVRRRRAAAADRLDPQADGRAGVARRHRAADGLGAARARALDLARAGALPGGAQDDAVHVVQHLSFFLTAALFWWALVHGRYGRIGYGVAVLFVFTTALHSGALGALFTFGSAVMYPLYAGRSAAFGVNALEDQQLAGLIMWIPFSLTFLIVGLALFAAWLGESDRRLGFARGPFSDDAEGPLG